MTIKGSLFSRVPIVSDFPSKIFRFRFLPKIDIWGPKQGLNVIFNFCNPKSTSLHDFGSFESSRIKIGRRVSPVCWSQKKGICIYIKKLMLCFSHLPRSPPVEGFASKLAQWFVSRM